LKTKDRVIDIQNDFAESEEPNLLNASDVVKNPIGIIKMVRIFKGEQWIGY